MKTSVMHKNEYNPYYQTYIDKVGDVDLVEGLKTNGITIFKFLDAIPESKFDHAYAEGKWTIKEVVQHIIDTERVFSYRALSFARRDNTELPGYDQDLYAPNSEANKRTKNHLINELKVLRYASSALFESFSESMLLEKGVASGSVISVRALGFILIGHENHHCQVIKDRYL